MGPVLVIAFLIETRFLVGGPFLLSVCCRAVGKGSIIVGKDHALRSRRTLQHPVWKRASISNVREEYMGTGLKRNSLERRPVL